MNASLIQKVNYTCSDFASYTINNCITVTVTGKKTSMHKTAKIWPNPSM